MCVLIGVNQLGFGAQILVLPLYAQSFGVTQFDIGLSVAVYGAARFVLGVPTGQVADRFGRRHAFGSRWACVPSGQRLDSDSPVPFLNWWSRDLHRGRGCLGA